MKELPDNLLNPACPVKPSPAFLPSHLGWPYARLNEIINGRRGISASSALAIGEALGTGPEFWLNLQRDWDLWHSLRKHKPVPPLRKVTTQHASI